MQYYIFKEACDTKETGPVYPQIQKWKPGYDDDKTDSYYSYYEASCRGRTFPDFTPDMDALVIHNNAKVTDLVSSGISIGFVVSSRLKILFEQFKFPPHRFYPTKIKHKNDDLDGYYFMHIISNYYVDYLDAVDYGKSVFVISGISKDHPRPITLTSKLDYLEKSKQLQDDAKVNKIFRSIRAEKIYFTSGFDKSLDCFVAPFGVSYFISQRLKDSLLENNVTGCDIQPSDLIFAY